MTVDPGNHDDPRPASGCSRSTTAAGYGWQRHRTPNGRPGRAPGAQMNPRSDPADQHPYSAALIALARANRHAATTVKTADPDRVAVRETGSMAQPPANAPRYPHHRATNVVLRDGSTVHVRPVRRADHDAIRAFLGGISPDSILFRFFGAANLEWAADWSVDVDYVDRYALIAETGTPARVIAHAAYLRIDRRRAEVAFLVADEDQGHGLSTIMLAHLAEAAGAESITTFVADVLPANHRMIETFRQSGFPVELRSEPGVIKIEFPTSMSAEAVARFAKRDRVAAVAAVRRVLEPRSVAIIGGSRRRGTVGGELLHNLLSAGFGGAVHVVNRHGGNVQGIDACTSIAELPGPVDLAVIAVPAAGVLDVARDCAAAGMHALVVISAGFAELGHDGAERQHELLSICRDAGMRLVGPNCLGVLNTAADVRLNATFAPHPAPPGAIGFLSQSGGLGIAIIESRIAPGDRTVLIRLGRKQGRPVGQPSCSTGSRTPAQRGRCSTPNHSATHASSRASRADCRRTSP
jgi:RimJ/RimL family protein N-acetyltransferase/predicted CoA-binding protein